MTSLPCPIWKSALIVTICPFKGYCNIQIYIDFKSIHHAVSKLLFCFYLITAVCMEKFHVLSFETLCELPDDKGYLPCEIACISYSLYAGIIDIFHRFVNPGRLPIGYRYLCQSKSKFWLEIWVGGFLLCSGSFNLCYDGRLSPSGFSLIRDGGLRLWDWGGHLWNRCFHLWDKDLYLWDGGFHLLDDGFQ